MLHGGFLRGAVAVTVCSLERADGAVADALHEAVPGGDVEPAGAAYHDAAEVDPLLNSAVTVMIVSHLNARIPLSTVFCLRVDRHALARKRDDTALVTTRLLSVMVSDWQRAGFRHEEG